MNYIKFHFSYVLFFLLGNCWSQTDSMLFEQQFDSIRNNYRDDLSYFKGNLMTKLEISRGMESDFFIAKCQHYIGKIYMQEARYDSAQYYFYKALDRHLSNGYLEYAASTHEFIAKVHFKQGEDSIALDHLYQSLQIKKEAENSSYLMSLYNTLGTAHFNLDNFDSSKFYYEKGLEIGKVLKDTQMIAASYTSLGDLLYQYDFNQEAIQMYLQSFELYDAQNRKKESAVPLYNLGSVYSWIDELDSALYYYTEAFEKAKSGGNNQYIDDITGSLAETYMEMEQLDSAVIMFQNYIAYRDSIYDQERVSALLKYQTKYQTKEAEQQAAFEKTEKEKFQAQDENKRLTIYSLLGAIGLIGTLVFFWRRSAKQKAELTELEVDIKNQEIDRLLKEQEAKSYAALLEGQNTERERIAQDLHDRLGGTLSAVKVHFGLMDQKIEEIKSENRDLFDKVNGMLNEAVQDVRRISHDLVSGRIAKLGLRGALQDLANVLRQVKKMDVDFFMDESLPDFDQKKEQEIYAIVQELVSNMLKHAQATTVDIQFNQQDEWVNIMVEDNGVGFSIEKESGKGLGITGLSKRVKDLKGTVNYDSVIGRGTIIIINIPI